MDMMDRNLRRASELIDNVLNQATLKMGVAPQLMPLELAPFLREIETDASGEANAKSIKTSVTAPGIGTTCNDGK